jgi:prepilin-type processing-associated H-X9-DG protein
VLTIPKLPPVPEVVFLPLDPEPEPEPTVTSGKAIASLALGVLLNFGCLSGLPAIFLGRRALRDIAQSGGRIRGRTQASAGIVLGWMGCLLTLALLFMPATGAPGEAARRAQCVNNLKQIGLAMHNYHEANGRLPAAAITDKYGRPLLSWRVAILPYLERSDLYSRFHLDEPWDSPHNLSLLNPMPQFYACPSDSTLKPGMTGYVAVIGRNTAFNPSLKPLRLEDISDGPAETILLGESRRSFAWTKPEDLPFDMSVPLCGLGSHHGYHNNGLNVLFVDGRVRFLKPSIKPSVLGALLTRDGNEKISQDSY